VIYLLAMANQAEARRYGRVFNEIAGDYDRHRPRYPDALIDRAVEVANLAPGAEVLEIGCGTGQLTRSLLARGLRVTAVEPGEQLIARAREQLVCDGGEPVCDGGEPLDGGDQLQFVHARLEEARLQEGRYGAAFSASAIHWVDPDVSWRKAAAALVDGGTLALISYFGLEDARSGDDQRALRGALSRIAPELGAGWPVYRDLDGTLDGVAERSGNVSEAWSWLGSYELARAYAAEFFDDVQLMAMPRFVEHSAEALNALLATMSFWSRLSSEQRDALSAENRALEHRLGRPIRASTAACLLTARRVARA
jgi:SAM-dependent methyltransferase